MELIVKKFISDDDIKKLEGKWMDESYMKYPVVNKDLDIYYMDNGKKKLLLKFRKNIISEDLVKLGWDSYKKLAKPSRGRGASAGPIDPNSTYWSKRNLIDIEQEI